MKVGKVRGIDVDLDQITNPQLKRVLRQRRIAFIFSHSDEGSSSGHTDYTEHTDGSRGYSERATHTDDCKSSGSEHSDTKSHTDRYSEHSEYNNANPNPWDDIV